MPVGQVGQPVYEVSKPTSRRLSVWGAVCLCSLITYLQGTVWQGCSMFMRCLNLPPADYWAGVQPVHAVSEPTSHEMLGRDAACLCHVQTNLPGTVEQGCSLFIWWLNLSPWDCWAGVQPVYALSESTSSRLSARVQPVCAVSEPDSRLLSGMGAVCLCCVQTYIGGTVGLGCILFIWCPHLPGRHAACLCSVGTFLPRTVGQGCNLFMWCPNLPPKMF